MSNILQRAVEAHRAGDLSGAKPLYEEALALVCHNLGGLHAQMGDVARAEHFCRQALAISPQHPEFRYALSLLLLRLGRYAEAWPLHEARRQLPRLKLPAEPGACPEWIGQDISGKRVVVLSEQGFGDQIMFARFLDPLRQLGAFPTLICDRPLRRLLSGVKSVRRHEVDYWCYAGSLPLRLGTTIETIPPPASLGIASRSGVGVGVVTAGNPKNSNNAHRSLGADDAAALRVIGRDLSPEITGASDFLETAEIIAGLKLVISVDTAIAHLAATMGKPTWILVPKQATDWRWLDLRHDSPWYSSVRLFRQHAPGDWSSVIAKVSAELAPRQ